MVGLYGVLVERAIGFKRDGLDLAVEWFLLALVFVSVGEGGGLLVDPLLVEVVLHQFFQQVLGVESFLLLPLHSHLLVETSDLLLHQLPVLAEVEPFVFLELFRADLLAFLNPSHAVILALPFFPTVLVAPAFTLLQGGC